MLSPTRARGPTPSDPPVPLRDLAGRVRYRTLRLLSIARALWVSNFGQLFRCAQDNLDAIERGRVNGGP
jgi:hypothetical protein